MKLSSQRTGPYSFRASIPILFSIPFVFGLQLFGAGVRAEHFIKADSVPQQISDSDWASIRSVYETNQEEAVAAEGGYRARNLSQKWQTEFDGRGFSTRSEEAGWSWGLELRRYGFAGGKRVLHSRSLTKASGPRVTYMRSAKMQEWFVNDRHGLEHGFTIKERPQNGGDAGAGLQFDFAIRGSLRAAVSDDGKATYFIDAGGNIVITYAGLKVWDTDGKQLPARFVARGSELSLYVDERRAHYPIIVDPIAQQAYLKASNTGSFDQFGISVAISGDTVVVGAPGEGSNATGINGDQTNNSAPSSGAAYVFVRNGGTWSQQAYLKASNTDTNDEFGYSVAISGDTIIVGALGEDSNATGVNGDQTNNSAPVSGAAYVFVRNGSNWSQQAYLKASNTDANDQFGFPVAISGDTIVIGASGEDSNATGINGDQTNNSATDAGATYVFARTGTTWSQQAYLKASNTDAGDDFGFSVAVSGNTVVVGAPLEASSATGINGDQSNNSAASAGAAYVFVRNGSIWSQQAYLKASNTDGGDGFGQSVAISSDTVLVGAISEASNATGVNGDQTNNSARNAGAAYVFVRNGGTWSQQAYLKASNTGVGDAFGYLVAISTDMAVVVALLEDSNAIGVDGDQTNDSAPNAGAAYVFVRTGGTWTQQAYVKASNTDANDHFGTSVAVSGNTVVLGAADEDSNATGVNGDQTNNSANSAGAAYVFTASFPSSHLTNVSARGFVGTGDNVLIAGVAVRGEAPTRILFRAIGPSLAAFGVSGPLQNPQLDLHNAQGALIAHNDNWMEEPDGTPNATRTAQINATGLAPADAREAAILATMSPGNYTAIVSGVGGTTGVALAEAYELGPAP
jgi:FG-GAP repeat protein